MGKFFDEIPANIASWINKQEAFWVATAPLSADGHVNVSPKGLKGCFHVVSPTEVWYDDMTGSGSETIAHLREPGNGRITIMFNAFEGPAQIVRLFGHGVVHEFGTPEYNARIDPSARTPGSRAIIVITVHKVGSSCGYSVPIYKFMKHRTALLTFAAGREDADLADPAGAAPRGLKAYWREKNVASIDGLPALDSAFESEQPVAHVPVAKPKTMPTDSDAWASLDSSGVVEKPAAVLARDTSLVALGFIGGIFSALLAARMASRLHVL